MMILNIMVGHEFILKEFGEKTLRKVKIGW
jgi:hypothetical protein